MLYHELIKELKDATKWDSKVKKVC
jgi:hypothetical protein